MKFRSKKIRPWVPAVSVLLVVTASAFTPARATNFTRGDTNADGGFDLSDGVNVLNYLFGTGAFNISVGQSPTLAAATTLARAFKLLRLA